MRTISFLGSLLSLSACVSPTASAGDIKGVAMIDRIEAQVADDSSYRFTVHGSLPDPCTSIDQVTVSHENNDWTVTITTTRPSGKMCASVIVPFERELLEVKPDMAASGSLSVNGVKKTFSALRR